MRKYLILFGIGLIIGLVLSRAIFYLARSGPAGDPVVSVNPTDEVIKQAEVVQTVKHEFIIRQPQQMHPGASQSVPVTVTVQDRSTGQVTQGETTAEIVKTYDGDLDISLNDVIAVDLPPHKAKPWTVGAYYGDDGPGGFVQRDFRLVTIKGVDVSAYGRIEIDKNIGYQVGLQLRF